MAVSLNHGRKTALEKDAAAPRAVTGTPEAFETCVIREDMKITHASSFTNTQLTAELSRLAHREPEATVAFIVHLAEFDLRRLHQGAGFTSLFAYCVRVLHFSEDAACSRIAAARIARRYPVVLDMLTDGRLSPTTARLLKRHLTRENHQELLAAASGKKEARSGRAARPALSTTGRALVRARAAGLFDGDVRTERFLDAAGAPHRQYAVRVACPPLARGDAAPAARWPASATRSDSPPAEKVWKSCASPRTCSATRSPAET